MADASGTPTPLFSIPTFNTAVDPPSGKGFNTAMASIDAAMGTLGISAIADEDLPVWNSVSGKWESVRTRGIKPSFLQGYPSDSTKVLKGDGTWGAVSSTTYRKTTPKDVVNTTALTDLLNGEITLAAGDMGTTKKARATLLLDAFNGTGAGQNYPQFQVVFGGTTLLDTGAGTSYLGAGYFANSTRRIPIVIELEIQNLGSASSQFAVMKLWPGNIVDPAPTTGIGSGVTPHFYATAGTVAVNTANAASLVVNVGNAVANANYSIRLQTALVEIV